MRGLVLFVLALFIFETLQVEALEDEDKPIKKPHYFSDAETKDIIRKQWGLSFEGTSLFYNNSYEYDDKVKIIDAGVLTPPNLALDDLCHRFSLDFFLRNIAKEKYIERKIDRDQRYAKLAPGENCDMDLHWVDVDSYFSKPVTIKKLISLPEHILAYEDSSDWCDSQYVDKSVPLDACTKFFDAMEGEPQKKLRDIIYFYEESKQKSTNIFLFIFVVGDVRHYLEIMIDEEWNTVITDISSAQVNI